MLFCRRRRRRQIARRRFISHRGIKKTEGDDAFATTGAHYKSDLNQDIRS